MVYYDHFGAYIPLGQEEWFYKRGLMSVSSEGFYKAHEENIKREERLLEIIKEGAEERKNIFVPKFKDLMKESKESNEREPIMLSKPKLFSQDSEEPIWKVKKEPYTIINFNPLKRHEID